MDEFSKILDRLEFVEVLIKIETHQDSSFFFQNLNFDILTLQKSKIDFDFFNYKKYIDEAKDVLMKGNSKYAEIILRQHIKKFKEIIDYWEHKPQNYPEKKYFLNYANYQISKHTGTLMDYKFFLTDTSTLSFNEVMKQEIWVPYVLKSIMEEVISTYFELTDLLGESGHPLGNKKATNPLSFIIIGKIYELCNNEQFQVNSEQHLNNVFTNPAPNMIKIKKGEKTRMEYLMYKLGNYLDAKNVSNDIFEAICNSFGLAMSDCKKRTSLPKGYNDEKNDFKEQVDALFKE